MLLRLLDVLETDAISRLGDLLRGEDLDAAVTSGQARTQDLQDAGRIVTSALVDHPLFLLGAEPNGFSTPTFTRLGAGMGQASRVAPAIIRYDRALRADLVVSICLSAPESYEGGELVVDSGFGVEQFKDGTGSCVSFPASWQYFVTPITRGTRIGAEVFVQSLVRDPAKREILFDIGWAAEYLELFGRGVGEHVDRLRRCKESLLRLWADP